MMRPHIQKGWLNRGEHRFGFVVEKRTGERHVTFDICWWWGWCMIYFSSKRVDR